MIEQKIEALTAAIAALTLAISGKPKCEGACKAHEAEAATFNSAAKDVKPAKKPEPVVEEKKPVVEVTKPVENQPAPVTYESVRAKFLELNTAKGREATLAALAKVGCANVPELVSKKADLTAALEAANEALAA